MTDEQKVYFLYGAIYQMAKDAKDDGLFTDLNIKQVIGLYMSNLKIFA